MNRRGAFALGSYGMSVAISAVVTLLTIPVVVAHSGASAWASLAVGQAVGTGAAILIGFGWGTTGPTLIARADPDDRGSLYVRSLQARAVLFLPLAVVATVAAFAFSPSAQLESSITALAYAATGLLAGWFFTGAAEPVRFLALDTLPRVLGLALGALALIGGTHLVVLPILQLLGVAAGVCASAWLVGRRPGAWSSFELRQSVAVLRSQSHGFVIALVAAGYASIPLSLVSLLAPGSLPVYALLDKLLRFATTAYSPVLQFLQGWVPAAPSARLLTRIRKALVLGLAMAVVGGLAFVFLAPLFMRALSHGEIRPDSGIQIAFGVGLACMVLSQISGLVCLLALGGSKALARLSVWSFAFGMTVLLLALLAGGVLGAAWGLAAAEILTAALQIRLLYRSVKSHSGTAENS